LIGFGRRLRKAATRVWEEEGLRGSGGGGMREWSLGLGVWWIKRRGWFVGH